MAGRISALAAAIRESTNNRGGRLVIVVVGGLLAIGLYRNPPLRSIQHGEVGIRFNQLTGSATEIHEGGVVVLPGLQALRRFSLKDALYHPTDSVSAKGAAPFQSEEGLSIGVDLTVRYALDPAKIRRLAAGMPEDVEADVVKPAVQGVIYKTLTHYSVREIFSSKRTEIQQTIENELRPQLAAQGLLLRGVQMGNVDLPPDYRAGMEQMLNEELASEKMRYTLELKDKEVKQRALEAEADKVARDKAAEAAGDEQIIAAKAQEEAMKHVLPFKQKQIEQRQLEAEAAKVARIKGAEGEAQARVIEAGAEADTRRKLADADSYRLEQVGKVTSEQMARDGALISKHPLLIQKALADKLSDKISVIIAPPGSGGFIGSALIGGMKPGDATPPPTTAMNDANGNGEGQ